MTDTHLARSTFWLGLAQAFLPPGQPELEQAFVNGLALDLAELAVPLELELESELAAFSHAASAFAAPQTLLIEYSRLFLPPNVLLSLNLSRYVDGSMNGPCMDALENAYFVAGVEQGGTLHDIGDHAAMQMECLAWLTGQADATPGIAPDTFAQICLVGALPRFAATLHAEAPDSPYTMLADIAARAIACYGQESADTPASQRRPNRRHDRGLGVWRHCKSCDKPFAREKEIQIMSHALEQAGLPVKHLALCPDCRDVSQGFFKRMIK